MASAPVAPVSDWSAALKNFGAGTTTLEQENAPIDWPSALKTSGVTATTMAEEQKNARSAAAPVTDWSAALKQFGASSSTMAEDTAPGVPRPPLPAGLVRPPPTPTELLPTLENSRNYAPPAATETQLPEGLKSDRQLIQESPMEMDPRTGEYHHKLPLGQAPIFDFPISAAKHIKQGVEALAGPAEALISDTGRLKAAEHSGKLPTGEMAMTPELSKRTAVGLTELAKGGFDAATPFVIAGGVLAPAGTVISLAAASLSGEGAAYALKKLDVPEEYAELGAVLAGAVGGSAGAFGAYMKNRAFREFVRSYLQDRLNSENARRVYNERRQAYQEREATPKVPGEVNPPQPTEVHQAEFVDEPGQQIPRTEQTTPAQGFSMSGDSDTGITNVPSDRQAPPRQPVQQRQPGEPITPTQGFSLPGDSDTGITNVQPESKPTEPTKPPATEEQPAAVTVGKSYATPEEGTYTVKSIRNNRVYYDREADGIPGIFNMPLAKFQEIISKVQPPQPEEQPAPAAEPQPGQTEPEQAPQAQTAEKPTAAEEQPAAPTAQPASEVSQAQTDATEGTEGTGTKDEPGNAAATAPTQSVAEPAQSATPSMAIVGNTYPNRSAIGQLGGRWDKEHRAWLMPDTPENRKAVANLSGVSVAGEDGKVKNTSVRDFPVTVTLKDGQIKAVTKLAGKVISTLKFAASDWPKSQFAGHDNPLYPQRQFLRQRMSDEGVADFNGDGADQAERIADAHVSAINSILGNTPHGHPLNGYAKAPAEPPKAPEKAPEEKATKPTAIPSPPTEPEKPAEEKPVSRETKPRSWKYELQIQGEGDKWHQVSVAFPTREEAESAGQDKFSAWMMANGYRVVESDDEPNYNYDGGLKRIPTSADRHRDAIEADFLLKKVRPLAETANDDNAEDYEKREALGDLERIYVTGTPAYRKLVNAETTIDFARHPGDRDRFWKQDSAGFLVDNDGHKYLPEDWGVQGDLGVASLAAAKEQRDQAYEKLAEVEPMLQRQPEEKEGQPEAKPENEPQPEKTGVRALIDVIYDKLAAGESLGNVTELNKLGERYLGGSRTSGAWTPRDLFDAMEAAVNRYLIDNGKRLLEMDPIKALAELRQLMGRITTQGTRTQEQIDNQQFSTPPTEAYIAAVVARLNPDDIVLEPSAGTGGLAAYPKSIGARVYVNEIAPRRREMLEAIGFDDPTEHDAELINALLERQIHPTVVLMNPPFSASTTKSNAAKNNNTYGFNHVEQALQRLQPGGRLVAILGGGQANEPEGGASFTGRKSGEWFRKIAERYNIRANIRISGKEYAKYGTSFATRIIVIDKDGPTKAGEHTLFANVVSRNVDTLEEAYELLKGIAGSRPEPVRAGEEPGEKPVSTGTRGGKGAGANESGTGLASDKEPGSRGTGEPTEGESEDSGQPGVRGGSRGAAGGDESGQPGPGGKRTGPVHPDIRTGQHPESESADGAPRGPESDNEQRPVQHPGTGTGQDLAGAAGLSLQDIIDAATKALQEKLGTPPKATEPAPAPAPPKQSSSAPSSSPAPRPPQGPRTKQPGQAPAPAPPKANPLSSAADAARQRLRDRLKKDTPEFSQEGAPALDPQDLVDLATIGGEHIVAGATKFDDWAEKLKADVGDLIDLVAQNAGVTPDAVLRQVHQYASGVAKNFGVEAEPTPPEPAKVSLEEHQDNAAAEEKDTEAYVKYKPTLKGPEHPGNIVETTTMATVKLPNITYTPNLPASVLENGNLSAVQMEAIALNGQANQIVLHGGYRGSSLIGDGTGVGKGRIAAGILWDNWNQGRKRLVWVTEKNDLMQDAARDFSGIGAADSGPHQLLKDVVRNSKGQFVFGKTSSMRSLGTWDGKAKLKHEGILFVTYALLRSEAKTGGHTRVEQLRQWLAGDDGGEGAFILFDEAHNLKNAVPSAGSPASQTGVKAKDLLDRIPGLRTANLSATAATEISNLGYLDRLGYWGPGTAFPGGFTEFQTEIGNGRMAAMELVAREMKADGKYISRTLSFKGVEYRDEVHEITPEQKALYRTAAKAWRTVLDNAKNTIRQTTNGGSRQRGGFMSAFYAAQLRFFGVLLTTLKIPTAVKLAEEGLAADKSVVISLVNTNEAAQNREKNKRRNANEDEDEEDFPDYDFGPKEMLVNLIREHYPVQQFVDDVDSNGRPIKVPLYTIKNGERVAVTNPEAERARDALIADVNQNLHMPGNPLDVLIESLGGVNKVAELTGRKERFDEGTQKFISRADPGTARKDVNIGEMAKFQNGQKRMALLSSAAGTGISLHADKGAKNQQKRLHITLQVGWSADRQMQMFGRTHRTNEVHPPEYVMLVSDLGGEKRFVATIARRLGSLGALTKGQKDAAAGTNMMEKVNFETEQGKKAANAFYTALLRNQPVPGTDAMDDAVPDEEQRKTVPASTRIKWGSTTDHGVFEWEYGVTTDTMTPDINSMASVRQDGGLYTGKMTRAKIIIVGEPHPTGNLLSGMEVLTDLGVLKINERTGEQTVPDSDRRNVPKLLNRLMALDPDVQQPIYNYFYDIFEAEIQKAIADGTLDTGVRAMPGDEFHIKEERQIATDPKSGAKTFYYPVDSKVKLDRVSPKELDRRISAHSTDHPVLVRNDAGKVRLFITATPIVRASGQVDAATRFISPGNGNFQKSANTDLRAWKPVADWAAEAQSKAEDELDSAKSNVEWAKKYYGNQQGHYQEELDKAQKAFDEASEFAKDSERWAKDQWENQFDDAPSHGTDQYHLIGGAVLRYWNAIKEASPFLDIFTTVDSKTGQRVVGVSVMPQAINGLLARISGSGGKIVTAHQMMTDVLKNGTQFDLEGGIRVRLGRVSRTPVIQLVTQNPNIIKNLNQMGVVTEKGISPIHYIPTEAKNQETILHRILETYPPAQGATDSGDTPEFSRESAPMTGFYSQLSKVIEDKMPAKVSAQQALAIIRNPQNGVKSDELKWTGIEDAIQKHGGMLTKVELERMAEEAAVRVTEVPKGGKAIVNGELTVHDAPRYGSYTLKGGTSDYRELLLTLPVVGPPPIEWNTGKTVRLNLSSTGGDRNVETKEWESKDGEERITFEPHRGYVGNSAQVQNASLGNPYGDTVDNLLDEPPQAVIDQFQKLTDDAAKRSPSTKNTYRSAHWHEPNVLAHLRFTDRTSKDGKKVLLIEEIQSDWHQEGRKKGYRPSGEERARLEKEFAEADVAHKKAGDARHHALLKYGATLNEEEPPDTELKARAAEQDAATAKAEFDAAEKANVAAWSRRDEIDKRLHAGVLDAPFAKTWHELAFRRALRYAAENGYDQIAWVTGAQQAERYDLAKHVVSVTWEPSMVSWDSTPVMGKLYAVDKKGRYISITDKAIPESAIEEYIGKDPAKKLLEESARGEQYRAEIKKLQEERSSLARTEANHARSNEIGTKIGQLMTAAARPTISGLALTVGGEGMRGFYDQILPQYAAKYAKKWGEAPGTTMVGTRYKLTDPRDGQVEQFDTLREAQLLLAHIANSTYEYEKPHIQSYGQTVHSLNVTPAMRQSVMEGQPLFVEGDWNSVSGKTDQAHVGGKPQAIYRNGTILGNQSALSAIGRTWSHPNIIGVRLTPKHIPEVVQSLRQNPQNKELADLLERHAHEDLAVASKAGSLRSAIKALRHERYHQTQSMLVGHLRNMEPAFLNHPVAKLAAKALTALGYRANQHAIEIGAHLAAGQFDKLGLTRDQAKTLFRAYRNLLRLVHGDQADDVITRGIVPSLKDTANGEANEGGTGVDREEPARGSPAGERQQGNVRQMVRRDVSGQPEFARTDADDKKRSLIEYFAGHLRGSGTPEEKALRANYGGFVGRAVWPVKNLVAGNLYQIRHASPEIDAATLQASAHRARAATVLRAAEVPMRKALGGSGISLEDLFEAFEEDRLRGIEKRYADTAESARASTDKELRRAYQGHFANLLDAIEGRQDLPSDLLQTATKLIEDEDYDGLRNFLSDTFTDAASRVTHVLPEDEYNRRFDDPHAQKAVGIYRRTVMDEMARAHDEHEGIFSDALGPRGIYFPLTAAELDAEGNTIPRLSKGINTRHPFTKPRNPNNFFATGLSPAYDPSIEALQKKLASTFHASGKYTLLDIIEKSRWGKRTTRQDMKSFRGPDGVDYPVAYEEARPPKLIVVPGKKPVSAPTTWLAMPTFIRKEVDATLKRDYYGAPDSLPEKAANLINMVNMMSLAEKAYHGRNIAGGVVSSLPMIAKALGKQGLQKLGIQFGQVADIWNMNPSEEELARDYITMARLGIVPDRYNSPRYKGPWAQFDLRARRLLYKTITTLNPDASPRLINNFVNKIGNYTYGQESAFERFFKGSRLGPFATAGTAGLRRGLGVFTGGPVPFEGAQGVPWRIGNVLFNVVLMGALWAVVYKLLKHHWPSESSEGAELGILPIDADHGRYSWLGRAWWGDGPGDGKVDMFALNPDLRRGLRATGLNAGYKAHSLGGNPTQMFEGGLTDTLNAATEPFVGPLPRAAVAFLLKSETSLTGQRDLRGADSLSFYPAVPKETGRYPLPYSNKELTGLPSRLAWRTRGAIREANPLGFGAGEAVGFFPPNEDEKGNHLVKGLSNVLLPGVIKGEVNPRSGEFMRRQAAGMK